MPSYCIINLSSIVLILEIDAIVARKLISTKSVSGANIIAQCQIITEIALLANYPSL